MYCIVGMSHNVFALNSGLQKILKWSCASNEGRQKQDNGKVISSQTTHKGLYSPSIFQ